MRGAEAPGGELVPLVHGRPGPALRFRDDGVVEVVEDDEVLVTMPYEMACNAARALHRRGYGR